MEDIKKISSIPQKIKIPLNNKASSSNTKTLKLKDPKADTNALKIAAKTITNIM